MSYDETTNYNINPLQIAKIMSRLDDNQRDAFRQAVASYNELTGFDQFAGDAINGGVGGCRIDISVDPRRPVVHVEVDAIRSGLFFRCEIGGDIVIQELAL